MKTFKVHTPETAPTGSKDVLEKIAKKYGFIPNLGGILAESPTALNGMLGLASAFGESSLTAAEQEIVLLTASILNKSGYCSAAHNMLAKKAGVKSEETAKVQNKTEMKNGRLEALRAFTSQVVEQQGNVSDAQVTAFINAGFTKAQVLEVVAGVSLKILTNYSGLISKPKINPQFLD